MALFPSKGTRTTRSTDAGRKPSLQRQVATKSRVGGDLSRSLEDPWGRAVDKDSSDWYRFGVGTLVTPPQPHPVGGGAV